MKKFLLFALLAVFSVQAMAERLPNKKKTCLSIGILNGGGGALGADFEFLCARRLSLQVGVGGISAGAAINYHFKDYINSSMVSIAYWQQGFGDLWLQSLVGPMYTYRAPRYFQCQAGLGVRVAGGDVLDNFSDAIKGIPICPMFSIGMYFPL